MAYIGSPAAPTVATVSDGTVTSAKLADDAVTSAKLDTNIDVGGTLDVTGALTADSNATVAGNLIVDTNTLYVDATNNRVGIGTASPANKLKIFDSAATSTTFKANTLLNISSNASGADATINLTDGVANNAVISQSSGQLLFGAGSGAPERMRIDGNGNVGIGVTPSSGKLHIYPSPGTTSVRIDAGGTLSGARRNWGLSTEKYAAGAFSIESGTSEGAAPSVARMTINSAGFVNFNPAGAQNHFPYSETVKIDFNNTQSIHSNEVSNSTSVNHIYFTRGAANVASTYVGGIYWNGSTLAYQSASDYRLKDNVETIINGIDKIKELNPVNFIWKHNNKESTGFIAHELQAHCPDAVSLYKDAMKNETYIITPAVEATYDEEGNELTSAVEAVMGTREVPDYQGVDQSKLVPLLTAALQEAITKIESLEARVATLESA